jgi:hypothetical protein
MPEIVRLEFPVFVSFTGRVVLCPTVSLPKLNCEIDDTSFFVGLEVLPLRATVTSAVPLLFLMDNEPLKVPEVAGLNPTAKYDVAPGAIVKGNASALILNEALLIVTLVTLTLAVLTFLIASVCVILFPTGTIPNDTDDGVEVSDAAWIASGARNMTPRLNRSAGNKAKRRRPEPPG